MAPDPCVRERLRRGRIILGCPGGGDHDFGNADAHTQSDTDFLAFECPIIHAEADADARSRPIAYARANADTDSRTADTDPDTQADADARSNADFAAGRHVLRQPERQ